jgi:hypothetical protein
MNVDDQNDYAGIAEEIDSADTLSPPVDDNPYSGIADELDGTADRRAQAQLRANVAWAKEQNPNIVADVMRAADAVGLPRGAVPYLGEDFLDRTKTDDMLRALDRAPITKELSGDRSFLSLAQDDIPSIVAIESKMDQFGTLAPGKERAFDFSAVRQAKNVGDSLLIGTGVASKGIVGMFLNGAEALGIQDAVDSYRWWIDSINRNEAALRGRQSFGSELEQTVNQGVESVPGSAAGIAISALGAPELGIPMIGAQAYGNAYIQARESGLSIGQSSVFAGQQAGVEMLTEKLPFDNLMRGLKAGSPLLNLLGTQLLAEIPGEQIATAWQDANEWLMLHPTQTLGDYMAARPKAAMDTLVATVTNTLMTTGGSAALNIGLQRLEAWRAERKSEKLKEIFADASNSKLRERDPQGFAQAVQKMADKAGAPEVYIEAQALAQIIDKAGEQASLIAPQLASALEQLPEAIAAGGDVRLPVGALVAAVSGTSIEQDILDNMRANPDALSVVQAKEISAGDAMAELEKQAQVVFELQQSNDTFMQSADRVHQEILGQLNQVKRFTETVNASYAELVKNFYAVQADKLGVTPEELYQKFPLQIASAVEPGAQGMDQAFRPRPFIEFTQKLDALKAGQPIRGESLDMGRTMATLRAAGLPDLPLVYQQREAHKTLLGKHKGLIDEETLRRLPDQLGDPVLAYRQEDGRTVVLFRDAKGNDVLTVIKPNAVSGGRRVNLIVTTHPKARPNAVLAAIRENRVTYYHREKSLGWFDQAHQSAPKRDGEGAQPRPAPNVVTDADVVKDETLRQGEAAPRGFYTPSARRISLLQNANLSTFLHETGHFFLDVYEELASQPDAHPEIARDMQTLLKWFGVKDIATWRALSLKEKRPYHEKFAEGFERYLFKGEAPSVDMQGLFAKFRAWMIAVYKSLKGTFSPEVKAVVDRMIASDMQIAQAEAVRNMAPIFSTAEQAGMTPEEFAAYHELAQRATEEARQDLQKRSLADMKWLSEAKARALREVTKDAKLKRAEVEAEVRDEVLRQPVYAAMRFMSHGELPPGFEPTNKAARRAGQSSQLQGNKISLAALEEMYGPGAPSLSTGKYGLATKKGGLHPQVIADLFGFRSVDEFLQAITKAEPLGDLVEGMTDQRMLERYGDISSPDALERAAEAAVHNEARARFIAAELAALQKANDTTTQTGTDRNGRKVSANTLVLAARKLAAELIGRTLVKDVSPAQYAAAEARNAKQTFEAMSAGDLEKAAAAKRQQLISHRTATEAIRAQAEVQKGLRYLSKFAKDKVRQNIDPEYVEQIFNLLERYDLRKSTTQRQMQRRQSLLQWYEAQLAGGQQPVVSQALLTDARKLSYKQLTVAEFRDLIDAVKNIEHLGRLKQRLLTNKDGREWDAIKADITTSLQANRTTDRRTYSEDGWRAKAADLWNGFLALHRKAASLIYEMDGFKDGGVLWNYFIRPMNERGALEASMRERATIDLSRIMKPLLKKGGLGGRRILYAEVGQSLTREQLITVALNRGNEGNLQRLLDGGIKNSGPLRIEQIDALLSHLTADEWKVVQAIWDYFDSYRPQIAEKERRVAGVEPEWIEPAPFATPHGTMRGGYYPIKYDAKASKKAEQFANAEAARAQMQAAFTSSTTRRSFTKNRAEAVSGRPLILNFSGIYQGLNEVIHDLAWHEWLIDANRILRDESIDRDMRSGWGPESIRTLTSAVEDIARGDVGAQNEFERIINHLRTGATIAGLGWNLMTSLMQPLGLTQSMVRVGTPWVAKGMTAWIKNPVASIEQIHAKSEFMRLRGKTMQRELNELENRVQGQSDGGALFQTSLFYMIQKFQALADVPTWLGAYEKALAGNETEERAIALADQAVLDAQGGGQQKDLAAIQRGGPMMKLFTNFYSFFNTTWNLAVERTKATAAKPSPQAIAGLAVDYALLFAVPAIAGELMRIALNVSIGGEPPDEEEIAKRLAAAQLSYLLGTLVGLREIGGAFGGAVGYSGPAGNRFFASLTDLGKQVSQGELDRPLTRKAIDVVGILTHLPSGQINRSLDGVLALFEGETANPAAVLLGAPR